MASAVDRSNVSCSDRLNMCHAVCDILRDDDCRDLSVQCAVAQPMTPTELDRLQKVLGKRKANADSDNLMHTVSSCPAPCNACYLQN